MFKKLRNRFLFLNLIIITILMAFSFSSIYIITYNNVHTDITRELMFASEIRLKGDKHPNPSQQNGGKDIQLQPDGRNGNMPPQLGMPQERSVSFTILIDKDSNTLSTISYLDLDSSYYDNAKNKTLSLGVDTGTFKIDESSWTFIKKPYGQGSSITFLNITSQQGILNNLIYTFLIVAAVMFLFIFFISKFFADRSIKPIKEAFEKQKQFIADSSHELKTPLAVINTNVDVLLANGESTLAEQSKWLNYIKSETERMTKLTNDLLYLTQMDYSDAKMIFSSFDLSDTVTNVILTMEAIIFENSINLNYDDISKDIIINGNKDQIGQVVMILLDNAVKYANQSGSINVSLKKMHHHAELAVTNTGEGISPEHIDKIFDRFYRTDKSRSRKSGGYGLGLAIAKAIVEQHGGSIYAESKINESTTFTVELPLPNS